MEDKDRILSWLNTLNLTIHELLRYGYGGLLAYLVAYLIEPYGTKKFIVTLGPSMNIILAFALGGAIYVVHRPIIGELLYLLHELVHIQLSRCSRKRGRGCTCRTDYFKYQFNLSISSATEAFRTVRDSEFYNQIRQSRFHRQHSELHMLYVTFFVLTIGAIVLLIEQPPNRIVTPLVLTIVALFALLSGFVGNILLCRQECKTLLLIPEETIRELLTTTEFIASDKKA
ncbi:MAG: hypothetical protein WBD28_04810 [Candidatus Zixiibacteriota bacterium]